MATTLKPAAGERMAQWWQLRSRPERLTLALAAGVVLAAAAWLVLWQPLVGDVERTTRQLATERAALAEARRQADDIVSLSRNAPAPPARDARAELDAALAHHALKPSALDAIDSDRLRLTFDSIAFDALLALLQGLQRDSRLRAVDLTSTARVESGQVRAELTLTQ